jgi:hypothetical protein
MALSSNFFHPQDTVACRRQQRHGSVVTFSEATLRPARRSDFGLR